MRRVSFRLDYPVLEEEADEVLLGLLARDVADPVPRHPPHRRWVGPPMYGDGPDGVFRRVGPRWWQVTPWEEARRQEAQRQKLEQEENARRVAEVRQRAWDQINEEMARRVTGRPLAELDEPIDWLLDRLWEAGEYLQVYRYLAARVARRGGFFV